MCAPCRSGFFTLKMCQIYNTYIYIFFTGTTYTGYLAMCAAINRALGMFVVQIIVVNLDVMVQTFIRENWGFLFYFDLLIF